MSLNKQEENLKFIDSLLYNNERRTKPTINKYDAREDIFKFMIAKEKILTSLYDIKTKSYNSTNDNNEIDYSQISNTPNNLKSFEEPQLNQSEEEMINMFRYRENLLQKAPGNFSLSSTHHDIKFERSTVKRAAATDTHFYFPKRKEHNSTKRAARGTLLGKKVQHPCYRTAASRRYRNRSKAPNSVKMEYSKQIDKTDLGNSQEISRVFEDKFLNFIEPVKTTDLHVLSTPTSPILKSNKAFYAQGHKRPGTMGRSHAVSLYSSQKAKREFPQQPQPVTAYGNFRRDLGPEQQTERLESAQETRNIPQHLFNFMRNASKELLRNNSESNSKDMGQGIFCMF